MAIRNPRMARPSLGCLLRVTALLLLSGVTLSSNTEPPLARLHSSAAQHGVDVSQAEFVARWAASPAAAWTNTQMLRWAWQIGLAPETIHVLQQADVVGADLPALATGVEEPVRLLSQLYRAERGRLMHQALSVVTFGAPPLTSSGDGLLLPLLLSVACVVATLAFFHRYYTTQGSATPDLGSVQCDGVGPVVSALNNAEGSGTAEGTGIFVASETGLTEVAWAQLDLIDLIAAGHYGTVWKCEWTTPLTKTAKERVVAAKMMNAALLPEQHAEFVGTFAKEMDILSGLSHPNIIKLRGGSILDDTGAFLFMELADRGSLFGFLNKDGMPYALTWVNQTALQIATGMEYLAARHVLHCDLKSANVLLSSQGSEDPNQFVAKICDFGLSKVVLAATHMTGTPGTPGWMAPEIISAKMATGSADVYSFAVVLWELVTRLTPWQGMAVGQVLYAVVQRDRRPPVPATCPNFYSHLLVDLWHPDPASRPNFTAIVAHLKRETSRLEQPASRQRGSSSPATRDYFDAEWLHTQQLNWTTEIREKQERLCTLIAEDGNPPLRQGDDLLRKKIPEPRRKSFRFKTGNSYRLTARNTIR